MFDTLETWYRNVEYFLYNIWRWRKSLWQSRPWDYSGVYLLLHDQLSYMKESIDKYSYHTYKSRDSHKIKVCLLLLERLIENDYLIDKVNFNCADPRDILEYETVHKYFLPRGSFKTQVKTANSREKLDKELLSKILSRNLNSWQH